MITFYFDTNKRTLIQAPANQAPANPQTWVYGDNYNMQVYVVANGGYSPILASDTITAILWQPTTPPTLPPQQQLAIVGTPSVLTDVNGNSYFQINVNLKTTQLAALVQSDFTPAQLAFHFVFNPADTERFSESQDIVITMNPDPLQGATGGTPIPPGYPSNPNVFEQIGNKNVAGGYAGLDGSAHLNPNQVPTDTTLTVAGGRLSVVSTGGGGGNAYVAVIPASFTLGAAGSNTTVTLNAATPDIVATAGQGIMITDGTHFINGIVQSYNNATLALTFENILVSGTGTMGANSHLYLGNASALASTTTPGLIAALSGNVNQFLNGQNAFTAVPYASLGGLPSTFAPATHGSQHLPTGNDPTPLGSPSVAGLMPPIDNVTITIVGGKLQANPGSGGAQAAVAMVTGSPAIPAAGATQVYTLSAAFSGFTIGQSVLLTDGTHILNGIVTAYSSGTPSITVRNTGSTNSSVSGNFGPTCYVFLGNNSDLASTTTPGIVKPDGTTTTVSGGVISAVGIVGQHGCRLYNSASSAVITTFTSLTWNTVMWGTDTYAPASGGSLITIPAGQTGIYHIGAAIQWTQGTSAGIQTLEILYNTSTPSSNAILVGDSKYLPASTGASQCIGAVMKLNAGDTLLCAVNSNTGGATVFATSTINIYNPSFWCVRIS
jgi:hypothetical protein